jgi:DNA-binding transcriptional LysR family regulator
MAERDGHFDWDDLQYFLRAREAGTLAGAARLIGVRHTTLGRRLTSLERALGAALVLRGPEGLKLTALGEKVSPLVEEVARAVAAVRAMALEQRSRVRLAVPSGFTRLFTAGLAQLAREHPAMTLELVSGSRPVDLKKGEADLALRTGPVKDPDLVARRVCESGSSLYAAKSYLARKRAPSDLDDLRGHDLIAFDPSLAHMPAAKWIEARATGAKVSLRSREMTDMVSAAVSGAGIALVPCSLGDAEPELVRLTPKVIVSRTLSLVFRKEAKLSREVRAVIEFVVDVIRKNEKTISGDRTEAPRRRPCRR